MGMTRIEFNEIVLTQSRRLFGLAFRFLRNREEAEDAVQEIFIRIWKMNDRLHEYNSVEALATAMTRNYCIDQIRKKKIISSSDEGAAVMIPELLPGPQEQMEISESGEAVRKIIENLPGIYRSVLVMREIEGLSFMEIAAVTGQNINSLRVNLSRARNMVRNEYNKIRYEYRRAEATDRKIL
jgi:RNA polymerase sigma factor (sigma-70 family)